MVSGSSTSSMSIFGGHSRTFRCSAMFLKGSETGFAGNSRIFSALQVLRCSFFLVILVLFAGLGWSLTGFSQ